MQSSHPIVQRLDKLLPACGHEGPHGKTLAVGQRKDKGNHLQEMEETEEAGRGTAEVLGNPKEDGEHAGMEDIRRENEKQCKRYCQPRQPLCQNCKERDFRPFRIGLPAGEERTSQPTEVLPRTEEIVVLIGTAVCGKPHVRWCERVDGVKRPSLYFNPTPAKGRLS